jgi:hypothetical protein
MTPRRVRPACWLAPACLLVLLAFGPAAAAQDGGREARAKALLEGTHAFRRILFDQKLEPLDGFNEVRAKPEKCILIVLGDLDALPANIEDLLRDGAAALLASDRAPDRTAGLLRKLTGVSIAGEKLVCNNPGRCYGGNDWCPLVDGTGGLPLFGEGNAPLKVATNLPSWLQHDWRFPGQIRPVARLPARCALEPRPGVPERGFGAAKALFAVGGPVGKGRLLLLADHSIFINEMMLQEDNNNVEFATHCVRWLREAVPPREYVLFVEDGRVQTRFDIPLRSVDLPLDKAARLLYARRNEILAGAEGWLARKEQEDFFNQAVANGLDRAGLTWERLTHLLVGLGTLALVLFGLYRLGIRHRFRHDGAPPLAGVVGAALPDGPVRGQRTEALLAGGNLWEPAAVLVRRWFARLGVEPAAGAAPVFTVRGDWWERRRRGARLRRLWQTALGRRPRRVSAPQLWRLQRELDELGAAHGRGAWGVVGPGA